LKNVGLETPLDDIQKISKHVAKFVVNDMYLMMGRDFELMDEVPSGNIFAIGGLEHIVLKSGTLSSTIYSPSFTDMFFQSTPIVRVAIEPKHPGN
jgi:ribosome assembly protein 1